MNECTGFSELSPAVSDRKQAIIASTFLVFVVYEVAVGVTYIETFEK